ncbi:NAD(P)-dependent methylenetetrahydromethanopterin dehydrogenase [Isosphaeraceae bacterium EP7]
MAGETPGQKPSILLQLDSDPQPSVFDAVVAVDSGVAHLLRHGGVTPSAVRDLVHGALFTRGLDDLKRTAIFVGGSDVVAAEAIFGAVKDAFFGPFRVSVLFDANGSNTTAAAAVLAALEGCEGSVADVPCAILGGTGPVGQRVARLLSGFGARVAVGSRDASKADACARRIREITGGEVVGFAAQDPDQPAEPLRNARVVIAAGAAGIRLLSAGARDQLADLKVAIDLNAVPPLGIGGIEATDKGVERGTLKVWGALGVGRTKMKIHKKVLRELFLTNDRVFDAEQVLELGRAGI